MPFAARLAPPPASPYEVERIQVCEQIFAAGGAKVVAICAAAGFGKTTVMRQVRQRCESGGIGSAWFNLDASDNDISRLLAGLAEALEGLMPGISSEEPGAASAGEKSVQILERIARHDEPFVLFLDDFESVHSEVVLGFLKQLIQSLPAGAQLIIGSRVNPDLGLGNLRASGRLLEIDPEQLRFSLDEVGDFLRSSRRLHLPSEDISRLHTRTEGWAAALWLASLALVERERTSGGSGKEKPSEFVARFSGSDAAIADYLAEDVLSHQAANVREFLLKTSILGTLNAEVCDAVCGGTNSQELLLTLERANLFVVPLDDRRSAYRYHGLFSEFLRSRLRREMPDQLPKLHHAAAEWYRGQSRPVPAIEHALLSGDLDYALPILDAYAPRLLDDARMRLLARWLGSIPTEKLSAYPSLQMVQAWAVNFTSGPYGAMHLVNEFGDGKQLGPELFGHLQTLKLILLLRMDRVEDAYAHGLEYFGHLSIQDGFVRSMFAIALGTTAMMLGKFVEAQAYLTESRRIQAPAGSTFAVAMSESVDGAIDLLRGHLRQAISRLRGALEPRATGPARYVKANALAAVLLAEALYEVDERAESERLLMGYLPLIQEGGLADQLISGHALLARLLALRGDVDRAFQVIMELEYVGHRLQLARVSASARLERAHLALSSGKIDAAGDELQFAADTELWASVNRMHTVANDSETYDVLKMRWLIRSGRAAETIALLTAMLADAESERRMRRVLKLRILLCEATKRNGDEKGALKHLGKALSYGFTEGFIRSFADEGETVTTLVQEVLSTCSQPEGVSRDYLERILAAAGRDRLGATSDPGSDGTEALTRKEMAVLQLVAQGLSNRALAQKLFLSETTIRTHLRNINAKLGVHSRVQAIAVARQQGYLP